MALKKTADQAQAANQTQSEDTTTATPENGTTPKQKRSRTIVKGFWSDERQAAVAQTLKRLNPSGDKLPTPAQVVQELSARPEFEGVSLTPGHIVSFVSKTAKNLEKAEKKTPRWLNLATVPSSQINLDLFAE